MDQSKKDEITAGDSWREKDKRQNGRIVRVMAVGADVLTLEEKVTIQTIDTGRQTTVTRKGFLSRFERVS